MNTRTLARMETTMRHGAGSPAAGRRSSRRLGRAVTALVGCLVAVALLLPAVPAAAASPPANDGFAAPKVLLGKKARVQGTTLGATREANEPDHYTDPVPGDADFWVGDHSVWYRWTAPASGRVTIETCAAEIDSILAVYTGADLGALHRVVDDNNGCQDGWWGSRVSFSATKGTAYRIAVADAGGLRESDFILRLKLSWPVDRHRAGGLVSPPAPRLRVIRGAAPRGAAPQARIAPTGPASYPRGIAAAAPAGARTARPRTSWWKPTSGWRRRRR